MLSNYLDMPTLTKSCPVSLTANPKAKLCAPRPIKYQNPSFLFTKSTQKFYWEGSQKEIYIQNSDSTPEFSQFSEDLSELRRSSQNPQEKDSSFKSQSTDIDMFSIENKEIDFDLEMEELTMMN